MCNAFLWRGAPQSARRAKVCWETVCTPKAEGGLGLKRLADWSQVLALKLIWLLFAAGGSLWVSWIRRNRIGSDNFWELNPRQGDSWIWKQLCKLHSFARPFVVCEIGTRSNASFWYDNWTELGPLIHLTGERGPAVSGMHKDAMVADALRNGDWWLSASRSRNAIISLLKQCLPPATPIVQSSTDDRYLWKMGNESPTDQFSTAKTWNVLHPPSPPVYWHAQVWFKGRVPKHAFISWLVAWNRLTTRDRMRSWGINISPSCLLCSGFDECMQHLFFECSYSAEVWSFFCSRLSLNPPAPFEECLRWLKTSTTDPNKLLIIKLIFQAVIYMLWKERNSMAHTNISRPTQIIIQEVKKTLQLRLDPISHNMRLASSVTLTPLGTWLSFFEFFL